MSDIKHNRATAADFNPIAQSVRASKRAAQPGSGIVVPNVAPQPSAEPPPDIDPRHVSKPAAPSPGAKTDGTFLTDCDPLVLMLLEVTVGCAALFKVRLDADEDFPPVALAFPPPIATELLLLLDLLVPTPTPVAVVLCEYAGQAARHSDTARAKCFHIVAS